MVSGLTPRELTCAAMRRQPTERIPSMPQLTMDSAIRMYAAEDGRDWIDGLRRCVENPAAMDEYVIRLVEEVNCDGIRIFTNPDGMSVERVGDGLIVLDQETRKRIGIIDTHGGGHFVPDEPEPVVETLDDVRQRLAVMVHDVSAESVEDLRTLREKLAQRFVATAPGGITMDTYTILRGRVQAMMDFYDRPEFVAAAMDMQAEAIIQISEKFLDADVDAFYIGDPAASASLISPDHFERFCLPAYQKFCQHFQNTDVLIYIHLCGNSNPILEMMADSGAHVVEPLDPLGGVSVADAKRRIGHRVALMGGVNTLTLHGGTPEEVQAESIQKCREGGPHGFILAAGDMIPPATPLENLQAMVDVATYSLWKE